MNYGTRQPSENNRSGPRDCLLLAVLVALGGLSSPAAAATITVNSTAQSPGGAGDCTLGEAIQAANTNAMVDACAAGSVMGTDTIDISMGGAGATYTLTVVDNIENQFFTSNGLPQITTPILIQGAGAATTIIERSAAAPNMRAFFTNVAGVLTLNDLTVQNFDGTFGGVVRNLSGMLFTANNCVFTGNDAGNAGESVFSGGGAATFNNTVITNNTSSNGPALDVQSGNLTLNNTTVSNNTHNSPVIRTGNIFGGVTATITDSTISNNTNTLLGSGGVVFTAGTLNITRSVISGNSSGVIGSSGLGGGGGLSITGGTRGASTTTISNSIISGNTQRSDSGGGISTNGGAGQVVNISGSLITGNSLLSGGQGGGIFLGGSAGAGGTVTIRNSTISGNSNSIGRGGGIGTNFNGALTLNNVTVTNNMAGFRAGGVYQFVSVFGAGTVTLSNTVIAGNSGGEGFPDCAANGDLDGSFISQGFNLIGIETTCLTAPMAGDLIGTVLSPINPLLAALADNDSTVLAGSSVGGETPQIVQTNALQSGSPAVDAGNNVLAIGSGIPACEATDQRGVARPVGLACDIGAFEGVVAVSADLSVVKTDSADPVLLGDDLTYTVTVANAGPADATDVTLTDTLPGNVSFASADSTQGSCSENVGVVTCDLLTLASGADAMVTIVVTPAVPVLLSNTAEAAANEDDPDASNNADTEDTGVENPVPAISLLSPTSEETGGSGFTLTVNGSGFVSDSVVRFNGSNRATTFNSSAQLSATILASDLATPGLFGVTVFTAAPGGGLSGTADFGVADVSLSSDPSSATINAGQSADFTLTATPEFGSWNNPITLACSGLPALTRCSFSVNPLIPGASPASSVLTVRTTAPMGAALSFAAPREWLGPPLGLALSGWLLAILALRALARRGRKQRLGVALAILLIAGGALAGCGSSEELLVQPGTPPGTHSFSVTATAGTVQRTISLTIVVR